MEKNTFSKRTIQRDSIIEKRRRRGREKNCEENPAEKSRRPVTVKELTILRIHIRLAQERKLTTGSIPVDQTINKNKQL